VNAWVRTVAKIGRRVVRLFARFYYPKIQIENAAVLPSSGPVLLAANHPNSLLDPILIGTAAGRPVSFLAKAPLFRIPVYGDLLRAAGMLPAFRASDDPTQVGRNTESLSAAARALAAGGAVGIFPEGKSHDRLRVEPVKSGAARIAVQAFQEGAQKLVVLPVGLNYEEKRRFRSALLVRFGEPISMAEWMAQFPDDERTAMRRLTQEIDRRLKEVVIHLEEESWRDLLPDVEALTLERAPSDPFASLRRRKRVTEAMNHFHLAQREKAEALAADLAGYGAAREKLGLQADAAVLALRGGPLFLRLARDLAAVLMGGGAALAGALFHGLPFLTVRLLSRVWALPGEMAAATMKLLLGVPIYGLWYAAAWGLLQSYFLPWVAWATVILMPAAGVFALSYCRRLVRVGDFWWRQVNALRRRGELEALRAEQARVQDALRDVAADYARQAPPEPEKKVLPSLSPAQARTLVAVSVFVMAVSAFWLLRDRPVDALRVPSPDLVAWPESRLAAELHGDEQALVHILATLPSLHDEMARLAADFRSGRRSYYRQEDNDTLRQMLLSYVNYRTLLFRLIWKYQNSAPLPQENLRLRSLLCGYAATAALYETSVRFVSEFNGDRQAIRKLNEAEPLWSIPEGLYDQVRANLAHHGNRRLLVEAWEYYMSQEPAFRRNGWWEEEPAAAFHRAIRRAAENTAFYGEKIWGEKIVLAAGGVKGASRREMYKAGAFLSTWIGDTKIRAPREGKPLIAPEQSEQMRALLRPGDIILERRNWFLSNAFLPGYWPHSALYVGTAEDVARLGLDRDLRVKAKWERFLRKDEEGHAAVILEAISEGVVPTSLEHSLGGADSVAVLRPRLPQEKINEAIARAFGHMGKPYDFDFDFFSTDKLVCTELVFRSYAGMVDFELVPIMGRKTLPAIEIVREFKVRGATSEQKLDFVFFLEGDEKAGRAYFRDETALLQTLERPPLTWLQPPVE
jgi:1-acyl-sn-glycerol-3-phosphate acyltransferase